MPSSPPTQPRITAMPRAIRLFLAALLLWGLMPTAAFAAGEMQVTETDHFQFRYPTSWTSAAQYLIKRAPRDVKRLEQRFGYKLQRKIQVRLASPGNAFANVQPHGWRPHSDIAGLAYPRRSLITLKIRRIEGLAGLHQTFVHEIAHILFAHASGFRSMPLWLNEGVAMWLSSDFGDFERFLSLARARSSGQIPALASLEKRFPASPAGRKLAYATSLDMTLYLRKQRADFLPAMMALVRQGKPWKEALKATVGHTTRELTKTWQQSLTTRYSWLPLIANEGTVWVLAAFLFVLAYLKVRRDRRIQWAQLEDDDDDRDHEPGGQHPYMPTSHTSPDHEPPTTSQKRQFLSPLTPKTQNN